METYKKVLLTVTTLAAIWLVYQVAVAVPRDQIEAEAEQAAAERRAEVLREMRIEQEYTTCKQVAYSVYSDNWDNTCVIDGKEPDCTLPAYRSRSAEEAYQRDLAACLEVYKARN